MEGVVVRGLVEVGGEGDRPVSLLDGLQCSVTLFSRTEDCSLVHSYSNKLRTLKIGLTANSTSPTDLRFKRSV